MIVATEDQSAEIVMQHMDQQYAPLHLVSMVTKYGTPMQAANAKDSDLLTKERLCRALSMFEVLMQRIKGILSSDEQVRLTFGGVICLNLLHCPVHTLVSCLQVWSGPPPVNGVMGIDECQEFHRLWSAIQFAYCTPPTPGQITVE